VIAKRVLLAATAVLLLVTLTNAQQRRWFELYDEAIQHVRRSEWTPAETKLQQAKKDGPAPGRTVLRYGMLRDDYFPDFYLGVVYLNTNRPKEALQAFQLARSQKLNVQDREFVPIADYENRAQRDAQRLAAADLAPALPPLKPIDKPAPAGDPVPPVPVSTAPVPDPGAERKRLETQFDQALQKRDLPTARQVLTELQKAVTDPKMAAAYAARVTTLDREIRLGASERSAMRAFFAGNYQQAVAAVNQIELELGGPLTPRGYFYRACGLAAQALRAPQVDTKALTEARRQYAEAMKSRQVIAPDRRYVSPRILQALGS
jgi:tetratricopeptide (TPR) repeat protein